MTQLAGQVEMAPAEGGDRAKRKGHTPDILSILPFGGNEWPGGRQRAGALPPRVAGVVDAGDVYLCPWVLRQRGELSPDHLLRLLVHGFAHLRFHTHEGDEDGDRMDRFEATIVAAYAASCQSGALPSFTKTPV